VNIASIHGRATHLGFGLYAAMKAGIGGLTRETAVHGGPEVIRANTVSPGFVNDRQRRGLVAQLTNIVEAWLQYYIRSEQTFGG
jgi:NAD(P)-dependent dehydrogenase (short-subunit alcohol dehydrogenase family)